MEIPLAHQLMMMWGKMLCERVSPILNTFIRKYLEVVLENLVFQPPQVHILSLGLLVAHLLMDKSIGRLVISLQGG